MQCITRLFILALWLLSALGSAFAQPQESEHFRITKSVLDAGGGVSTSENFRLTSAFGQPSPLGELASTDFRLIGGFLSPMVQLSPLSPVQALVLQQQGTNAFLSWTAVPGAGLYRVYRATTPNFTPGPTNLIGSTSGTNYTDSGVISQPALRHYYIITADHGSATTNDPAAGPATAVAKPKPAARTSTE